MGNIYVGADNQLKRIKAMWVGVNGVPKKVKNAWVGVNNVPKVIYTSIGKPKVTNVTNDGTVYWKAVSGASYYKVKKLQNGSWITSSVKKTTTSYQLSSFTTSVTAVAVIAYATDTIFNTSDDYATNWIKITYNGRGGTPSKSYDNILSGNSIGTLPTATREGYDFDNWWDSNDYRVYETTPFYSSATIYAHWIAATTYVTVYYKGNGGTPSKSSDTVESGSRVRSASCSRSNSTSGTVCYSYYCTGWYTSSSGGSLVVDTYDYFNPTRDMYLYAHWSSTAYLKIPSNTSATKGSKTISFNIHNPSGKTIYYRFYKTVNGSTWYQESSNHTTTSDGTITATINMKNAGDIHYYTIKISDGTRVTWSDVKKASGGTYQSSVSPPDDWVQPVNDYA